MNEKILQKYTQLIADINSTIQNAGQGWPDTTIVTRVITEAMNLIKKTCGENSDHYIRLKNITTNDYHPNHAVEYKGVIEAAYNDYKDGFVNLDSFVRAEIFEDFLSMSEYLIEQGYYVPAASLAGGILEDSLRKLCDKNNISYPQKTKINSLNIDLAKAGIYTALVSKEITAKADIRNNADHGKDGCFTEQDVKTMIEWIRRFVIDYLQ
jgi:hypothetical protein